MISVFERPTEFDSYPLPEITNPAGVLIRDAGPLPWRVPQVKANPELAIWFLRWIVIRETGEIVGSISFHAPPDASGMIEIGLGIEEPFRRNGYAREALVGMWDWVVTQPGVETLRYTVGITNQPSINLIQSMPFELVGQQIDEEDGPEDIYEISKENYLGWRKFSDR
ncbi:MAG: GNAT family N-acetyltransferase [Actinomycetota bacterium]